MQVAKPLLKTIIVEDEPKAAKRLIDMLSRTAFGICHVLEVKDTVAGAIRSIELHEPDLLFLDIQLGNEIGFDILTHFEKPAFKIVFTTAYDEYALKAFKVHALDYLQKPIIEEELIVAIEKVVLSHFPAIQSLTSHFIENFKNGQHVSPKKIPIPTSTGYIFEPTINIIRCESIGNYTKVYIKSKEPILVSKTLKHFEDILDSLNFFRVHNSHLINIDHVISYSRSDGGFVIMSDNAHIEISVRKREAFLAKVLK